MEAECDDWQNRRIERTILYAGFRYKGAIEDVHYHADEVLIATRLCAYGMCVY
jgi:hypothetical protein